MNQEDIRQRNQELHEAIYNMYLSTDEWAQKVRTLLETLHDTLTEYCEIADAYTCELAEAEVGSFEEALKFAANQEDYKALMFRGAVQLQAMNRTIKDAYPSEDRPQLRDQRRSPASSVSTVTGTVIAVYGNAIDLCIESRSFLFPRALLPQDIQVGDCLMVTANAERGQSEVKFIPFGDGTKAENGG